MKKPKPEVIQTPYQQNQVNTYGTASIADTPEARAYLDMPIDLDPGVGRRADLAEQEMRNKWNSAFAQGIPAHLRMRQQDAEARDIQAQHAAESQQANYAKTLIGLERRKDLLSHIVQTSGQSSGYGSQVLPAQPSIWNSIAQGAAGALVGAMTKI